MRLLTLLQVELLSLIHIKRKKKCSINEGNWKIIEELLQKVVMVEVVVALARHKFLLTVINLENGC